MGHAAVQLRYIGSRMPTLVARLLRFLAGIGGYQILETLPIQVSVWATPAFVITCIVMTSFQRPPDLDRRVKPGGN